ncbi:MAG TPA: isochorismatase family cysteine hydrolase [Acidobacteriota bacterium]|nr:isochorismatase family cysteine hydrolase [Acidobacteriota bacterium]
MTTTADLINPLAPIPARKPAEIFKDPFNAKYVFWNIDTQYDFMREGGEYKGLLPVTGAQAIEPTLVDLTALAQRNNVRVVNTADWHKNTSAEISLTPDFVQTYPPHCMEHTQGARYVPATRPVNPHYVNWTDAIVFENAMLTTRDTVILKDKFDVFTGNRHAEKLTYLAMKGDGGHRKTAIVYGVATNVCVDYAVMGLRERGYDVMVPTDAIKHLPHLENHPTMNLDATLAKWKKAGVVLTTAKNIEALL